jgi:hypothetical protein
MFRTNYVARKRTRFKSLSCSLSAALLLSSGPAAAQSLFSANDKAVLQKAGFTPADFKAAQQVQIAPHYASYQAWLGCVAPTLGALINTDHDAELAFKISLKDCAPRARELRASIARPLGLDRAQRVVNLLSAGIGLLAVERWEAKHPGKSWMPQRVGNWIISWKKDEMCVASLTPSATNEPILAIANHRGSLILNLQSRHTEIPSQAYQTEREMTVMHAAGSLRTKQRFKVYGKDRAAFESALDTETWRALQTATVIILHGPGPEEQVGFRGDDASR